MISVFNIESLAGDKTQNLSSILSMAILSPHTYHLNYIFDHFYRLNSINAIFHISCRLSESIWKDKKVSGPFLAGTQ